MMRLHDFLLARITDEHDAAMAYVRWDASETDVKPDFSHIGSHFPDRVLAECEAKRRIVEEALAIVDPEPGDDPYAEFYELDDGQVRAYGVTLRLLALPYEDHPDYQEEWRP